MGGIVRVCGRPDERIAAVARLQRGRVSRAQLLAIGVSDAMISVRLGGGTLHSRRRGVYAVGAPVRVEWDLETEVLLLAAEGTRLAGGTAVASFGLTPRPETVEVIIPRGSELTEPGVLARRPRRLPEATIRHGLPVTSLARALRDQAAVLPRRELERQIEEALLQRLVTRHALEAASAPPRARGARALRAVLAAASEPAFTRSEAERRLLELIRSAGLPTPLTNVRRHGYEIDFVFPDANLAIEVDGYRFHGGRTAFERDRRKGNRLTAAGVTLLRITWMRIADDPLGVVAEIAGAHAHAVAGGGAAHPPPAPERP